MKRLGYYAALDWIALNDDTESLKDAEPIPSVTVCFAADIYDKEIDDVMRDLARRLKRHGR